MGNRVGTPVCVPTDASSFAILFLETSFLKRTATYPKLSRNQRIPRDLSQRHPSNRNFNRIVTLTTMQKCTQYRTNTRLLEVRDVSNPTAKGPRHVCTCTDIKLLHDTVNVQLQTQSSEGGELERGAPPVYVHKQKIDTPNHREHTLLRQSLMCTPGAQKHNGHHQNSYRTTARHMQL